MSVLATLLWIPLLAACLLAIGLLLQVLASFCYRSKSPISTNAATFAVLMPAHNEALGIAATLAPLQGVRVLVVADNCSDETSAIAKQSGAEVIERQHDTLRGKGYALDYGLQHLRQHPPQVVVILDADCQTNASDLNTLVSACMATQKPVQALYLMDLPANASMRQQISTFAWRVKNWARPLGMHVLGLPCQLMGTGMAFLWQDLAQVNLASGHIVEDMKLGTDLAALGKAPLFCPQVRVNSQFPTDTKASTGQRTRWEHGHISVILSEAPKLLWQSLKQLNLPMLAMALDLTIPPLALLSLLGGGLSFLGLALHYLWPVLYGTQFFVLSMMFFVTMLLAIWLAWWRVGRDVLGFNTLCAAPWYALAKIPLYCKFIVARQVEWVRSKRD